MEGGEGPIARLELYTGDMFATAFFYGGVLGWAGGSRDSCEVEYTGGQVAVRDGLRTVATLKDAVLRRAALNDAASPGWHACFRVADVDLAATAAVGWGGESSHRQEGHVTGAKPCWATVRGTPSRSSRAEKPQTRK